MAKVSVCTTKRYDLHLEGLSESQVLFLQATFQNSPQGYHLADEPQEEMELRRAIFEACNRELNG